MRDSYFVRDFLLGLFSAALESEAHFHYLLFPGSQMADCLVEQLLQLAPACRGVHERRDLGTQRCKGDALAVLEGHAEDAGVERLLCASEHGGEFLIRHSSTHSLMRELRLFHKQPVRRLGDTVSICSVHGWKTKEKVVKKL